MPRNTSSYTTWTESTTDETVAMLEQQVRAMEKGHDQQAKQRQTLEQQLTAAELRRAEAERETEVLERQLDALTYRLAQGGAKPAKPSPRNPARRPDRVKAMRGTTRSVCIDEYRSFALKESNE
ncbi:MAG: hypothetical protein R3F37_16520 [Candidatus Competibacteraceae bacterium]